MRAPLGRRAKCVHAIISSISFIVTFLVCVTGGPHDPNFFNFGAGIGNGIRWLGCVRVDDGR
jgi:hypothetical protein